MNYPWNETQTIPEPFEMEWTVTDKTGEEIPCTVKGFYNSDMQSFEELQILDEVKNDITKLFPITKADEQEIESDYNLKFIHEAIGETEYPKHWTVNFNNFIKRLWT